MLGNVYKQSMDSFELQQSILIAGGYGVVGQQLAKSLRERHPDIPLVLAGRTPEKAQLLSHELGKVKTHRLDTNQACPLAGMKPLMVVSCVNDSHNHLLDECLKNSIPYIDITRWTERYHDACMRMANTSPTAPVILSSGWMAGVVSIVACIASQKLAQVNDVDISILYSLKDKAGPNSIEYMDRLSTPFEMLIGGTKKQVRPFTDPRQVTFPDGYRAKVYRIDTPDLVSLPKTLNAKTVAVRIAFDDKLSTASLAFLVRSKIWSLFSSDRWKPLREKLLYNPGQGGSHQIVVKVSGLSSNLKPLSVYGKIVDPKGQTHLTSVGALIQIERLLNQLSSSVEKQMVDNDGYLNSETKLDFNKAMTTLTENGVIVTFEEKSD